MKHDERRKNTRVAFRTTALVSFADRSYEEIDVRDLSLKGAYLYGVTGRNEGDMCDIDLLLSGTSSELKLTMRGEVARTDDFGAGIHFKEVDIDTFFHLKNIVYYNSDDPDALEEDVVDTVVEEIPEGAFE